MEIRNVSCAIVNALGVVMELNVLSVKEVNI